VASFFCHRSGRQVAQQSVLHEHQDDMYWMLGYGAAG
jgi:hypothetical protein